jgi:site-specific recombinase XerD
MLFQRRQPANKGRKLPPEPLTSDEIRRLLRVPSNKAPTGIRNRALLTVFYRAGLRCNEALALKPKDLDSRCGIIRVLHGKGGKSRIVGLDAGAWAILHRWMDTRTQIGLTGRQRVFCTLEGNPVQAVYVRNLLRRLGRKAGIEKRVHPHGLRHTHAFELANEGVPLHVIQHQLGHSSLATTETYIRHLNPQEVVTAMRSREWEL